jgi:hypothetical protein
MMSPRVLVYDQFYCKYNIVLIKSKGGPRYWISLILNKGK